MKVKGGCTLKHSWVLSVISVFAVAGTATAASTLYAATGIGSFKSTDSGGHWALIANGNVAPFNFILTVAVDPQTPSTVYIGDLNGTFKSTKGGTSFAPRLRCSS